MVDAEVGRVLGKLRGVKEARNGWMARCPCHDDSTPSLSVTARNGKVLLHCHAGCSVERIVAALGLSMTDLFEVGRRGGGNGKALPPRQIEATYDYRDEAGTRLFQAVRFRPKGFSLRRPDGKGNWVWDMKGVRRVLYQLPQVLTAAARGERVYVVEGEKDVHALERLGLTATTNSSGAGKWCADYTESLRGAHVVILPDNDGAGRKHAEAAAGACAGRTASVTLLALPGLPEKGDVSDWLEAGHTREELEALVAELPTWQPAEPPARFALTDLGNAERLVAACGGQLRYHCDMGEWLHWTGALWAQDKTREVYRLAAGSTRRMLEEAAALPDLAEQAALVKHALKSESSGRLTAAVDVARWQPEIVVRTEKLDADPWALNVLNGTLDLRTGELRPHDAEALHTKLAPVAYAADAACPRWEQFLAEVFADDPELPGFLRLLTGYLLTGDTREQAVFFLVGKGANGKSVLLETLRTLLRDYVRDTPVSTFLDRRDTATNDLAALVGARLVTASEGSSAQAFNEALLKRLTGEDPITCRFLYREHFTYYPTYKLLFATNEVPRFTSQTYATKRRVRVIPFRRTFYGADDGRQPLRDPDLREKLRAELPGILAWAVRGCREWQEGGLPIPAVVTQETAGLLEAMDPLADFLATECTRHPAAEVETGALWRAYTDWCAREERPAAYRNREPFTRSLSQRDGVELRRRHRGRYLSGLGLLVGR